MALGHRCRGLLALLMALALGEAMAGSQSQRALHDRLASTLMARPYSRAQRRVQDSGGGGGGSRRLQAEDCGGEVLRREVEVCFIPQLPGTETCDECYDGADNDMDGQIDCDDPDCKATMHCKNLLLVMDHFNDLGRTDAVSTFGATVLVGLLAASAWAMYRHVGYEAELQGHRMASSMVYHSHTDAAGPMGLDSGLTSSLSGTVPDPATDHDIEDDRTTRLDVGHLYYWIETKDQKQVLTDVSASFLPGTLTAVMGPSGCGKTVLLNQLSGRAKVGEFKGVRAVNGEAMEMQKFTEVMQRQAYVRQEDTHFEELTVRETMMYSAMLALPESASMSVKIARVEHVIKEVGLDICADALVGGVKFKGISGGQKRRLSIAIELLRAPSIIMLDEPTSGLDATTSLKLVKMLSKLAKKRQRTMIATIHQPRAEIFEEFDNLLLLGQGGAVIFFGAAKNCVEYLNRIAELRSSSYDNPGDYIIDVVGLDPEREGEAGATGQTELALHWAGSAENKQVKNDVAESVRREPLDETGIQLEITGEPMAPRTMHPLWTRLLVGVKQTLEPRTFSTTTTTQIWVLFSRRFRRVLAAPWIIVTQFVQNCVITFGCALTFSYEAETEDRDILQHPYKSLMFLFCITSYCMVLQYLLLPAELNAERPILKRERDSSLCRMPSYLVACFLNETPRAFIQALTLFFVGRACGAGLNGQSRYSTFGVLLLTFGAGAFQSLVAVCSAVTDSVTVTWNLVFLFLGIGAMFGGLVISFSCIPPYFKWAYETSIPGATQRALIVNEYSGQHIEIPCSHLARLAYASASDAVGDPAFYGRANSLLLSQARERAQSPNLDANEEATNDALLQIVATQNAVPGSSPSSLAVNASLVLGSESDFIAQMCDDPCRRVDLGQAMVRAMELDRTDAQATLLWLVFWLFVLRVVGFMLMSWRERRSNKCKEIKKEETQALFPSG